MIPEQPAALRRNPVLLFAVTLFIVGINLRPALSGVAPLLDDIRSATGLSAAGAGGLTTLPVLCFGLIAPFGPYLLRRFSAERAIQYALLMLAAGVVLRAFLGFAGLFAGTLLSGISIGVVMVLLPGIIKRDFSERIGWMTGLYTMALCLGAALAAGLAVPIQRLASGSWRVALAFWALPALTAAMAWAVCGPRGGGQKARASLQPRSLYLDFLAWQVALLMGLQSAFTYCVFGWLPTILIERGFSPLNAGAVFSASIAAQLVTALIGPWIATLGKDQRAAIATTLGVMLAGVIGCMYAPLWQIWLWALLLGLGQGGCLSVATMLVILRSPDAQAVAALSGMTQLVGYVMAAGGPFLAGLLRDRTGGWDAAAVFFVAVTLAALAAGLGAGRRRVVRIRTTAP